MATLPVTWHWPGISTLWLCETASLIYMPLLSLWQHVKLFKQICPLHTLACCWIIKQPVFNSLSSVSPLLVAAFPSHTHRQTQLCVCTWTFHWPGKGVWQHPPRVLMEDPEALRSPWKTCPGHCNAVQRLQIPGDLWLRTHRSFQCQYRSEAGLHPFTVPLHPGHGLDYEEFHRRWEERD